MHRKNYDQKIITQFDIVGSFFIDTFYNDLYLKSKDAFSRGKSQSLTDSYRNYITQYVKTIGAVTDAYMKVVKNLHEYHQAKMSYPSTLSEFIDSMVSKFIPPIYYRDFTPNNKDRTLHEIIIKTTYRLGVLVCGKDMLHRIIDDHRNPTNVSMLQDMILDIFLTQREEYYSKFTNEIASENDKIPVEVYNKMKSALCVETKKRTDCEIERDKLIGIVNKLLAKCNDLSEEKSTQPHSLQTNEEVELKLKELERKQSITEYNIGISERALCDLERKKVDIGADISRLEREFEIKQSQVEALTLQVVKIQPSICNLTPPVPDQCLIDFTIDDSISDNTDVVVHIEMPSSDDGDTYDPWK